MGTIIVAVAPIINTYIGHSPTTPTTQISMVKSSVGVLIQGNNNSVVFPKVDIPEPKFSIEKKQPEVFTNGIYKYEYILNIETSVPIRVVRIYAYAKTISGMEINSEPPLGLLFGGALGKGEGFEYTTIKDARGKYLITITTNKHEDEIVWKVGV